MTKFTRPDGNRTTMAYDGNHRLTGWSPLGGPRYTLAYDGSTGKATSLLWPLGGRVSLTYR
ncbi:MAG: hypothetical protein U0796_00290 [Gemmatales bacterium]